MVFGLSLFALFGAQHIKIGGTGFVGAGALAVLALTFTANLRWKKDQSSALLRKSLLMIWLFVQPFLFGLIGAAVDVYSLLPVDIGKFDLSCTYILHNRCLPIIQLECTFMLWTNVLSFFVIFWLITDGKMIF